MLKCIYWIFVLFTVVFSFLTFVLAPLAMHFSCQKKGLVAVQGLLQWYCVKEVNGHG